MRRGRRNSLRRVMLRWRHIRSRFVRWRNTSRARMACTSTYHSEGRERELNYYYYFPLVLQERASRAVGGGETGYGRARCRTGRDATGAYRGERGTVRAGAATCAGRRGGAGRVAGGQLCVGEGAGAEACTARRDQSRSD